MEVSSSSKQASSCQRRAYASAACSAESPLWKLAPFIDFPGSYGSFEYRFEWEREWRVPGGLSFSPDQVAFLFIPAELHPQARKFFDDAERMNTGPNYWCPFLDPLWPDDRIQAALADL